MEFIQTLITGLGQGCLYGLVALGFVLIYKASEVLNFAQGDIMMLGAFFGVTFITVLELPYWLGFLLAVVTTAVVGYLLDMVVIRKIIGESQISVFILTLGIAILLQSASGAIWGTEVLIIDAPYSGKILDMFGLVIGLDYIVVIIGTLLLSLALFLFFKNSNLGIAMQAASQNQLAAYYMGIPVKRIFSLIWGISAAIAAVAGILLAPISLVSPEMGFIIVKAFAGAIIGGFGSLPGVVLGGLIIGITEQMAAAFFPAGFQEISAYLVMFLVLAIKPQGLFAQIQQKKV